MLMLSRQKDESIVIGDDIIVMVVDIRGDKVRLGIQAPNDVTVHREEVYLAIARENARQAGLNPDDVPSTAAMAALRARQSRLKGEQPE